MLVLLGVFKDNPAYILAASQGDVNIYTPANITEYHTSRYVAAMEQQIYAASGANKETLKEIADEILLRTNKTMEYDTRLSDISALANSILYRLKYPVDQHCAIRIAAILSFMEYENEDGKLISEDPNKSEIFWTQKKERLAMDHPAMYTFFLNWGISNLPEYNSRLETLIDEDYFLNRDKMISEILPQT